MFLVISNRETQSLKLHQKLLCFLHKINKKQTALIMVKPWLLQLPLGVFQTF